MKAEIDGKKVTKNQLDQIDRILSEDAEIYYDGDKKKVIITADIQELIGLANSPFLTKRVQK